MGISCTLYSSLFIGSAMAMYILLTNQNRVLHLGLDGEQSLRPQIANQRSSANFTFGQPKRNFSNVYANRRATLQEFCLKHQDDPILQMFNSGVETMSRRMQFDFQHGFAYCSIAKSSSPTWSIHLARVANIAFSAKRQGNFKSKSYSQGGGQSATSFKSVKEQMMRTFYSLPPDETLESARSKLVSFAFVRNPFDRLVSVYNQKIARPRDKSSLIHIWLNIVKRYRNVYKFFHITKHPTPIEFVKYVISECAPEKVAAGNTIACHSNYRPQGTMCPFCYFGLDFMGKINTFTEDTRAIARTLNLQPTIPVETDANHFSQRLSGGDKTKQFFDKVPRSLIRELYEMVYKWDFEMFGFPVPDFEQMGRNS